MALAGWWSTIVWEGWQVLSRPAAAVKRSNERSLSIDIDTDMSGVESRFVVFYTS